MDRNITGFVREVRNVPSSQNAYLQSIAGVRICCTKEVANGRPKYEAISVSADSSMWTRQPTSHISERIGLPIIAYNSSDCEMRRYSGSTNLEIATLHLDSDPLRSPYEHCSSTWDGCIDFPCWINMHGCVTVVRKDRKPLLPAHVEALCSWCRFQLFPAYMRNVKETYYFKYVTREKFSNYYDGWLAGKGWAETGPANPCRDAEGTDKSSVMSFIIYAFIWSKERGLFKFG
jgi:hypothetical protein